MQWSKLTFFAKAIIVLFIAGSVGALVYYLSPGLRVGESKQLQGLDVSDKDVNNLSNTKELALPGNSPSTAVASKPLVRIGAYAWNAQSGIIGANGGPRTTEGSLMEKNGVNLEIIRQDWLSEWRNLHLKFIEEFDEGKANRTEGVFAVMIMGDGAPYYISSVQQALDDKYGVN
jgi:hypothetical protein